MIFLRKASYFIKFLVDSCYCMRLGSSLLKSVWKHSEMINTPTDWTKEAIGISVPLNYILTCMARFVHKVFVLGY